MSAAWSRGSSRAWRRLRRAVLVRDGYRCKVPSDDHGGVLCGAVAKTVGHLDPLHAGGPLLTSPDRLRAECSAHNYADGARIANARRRRPEWSW